MLDLVWPAARAVLFRMDPERAHELTLQALSVAPALWGSLARLSLPRPPPALARRVFGLEAAGPIGLAAGLDKNGVAVPFWPALGFGFVEVGTVTAHAQPGNDRPRLFRYPDDAALINRMGFNNRGSANLAARLGQLRRSGRWPAVPIGANIGKSKVTPLPDARADYATSARQLRDVVDYFTVNVSSPNTPGLRALQEPDALGAVLRAVLDESGGRPVLLKLAPDLEPAPLAEAVDLAARLGIAGIVATNTTLTRDGLSQDPHEAGGLSGRPLWPLARARIQTALDASAGRLPVVGCGGIEGADQVQELLEAGCVAVQLYSALIFQGPGLPTRLNRALVPSAS